MKNKRPPGKTVQLSQLLEELTQASQLDVNALSRPLQAVLQAAQEIIDHQAVEIEQLRKRLFGRRSEKLSTDQLNLFAQVLAARFESSQEQETTGEETSQQGSQAEPKRRHKTPRRPLQPTRIEPIAVPDQERPCPHCGGERCTFDHVPTLVVEYVPPKVEVIEYRREKLVCRACEGEIATAPLPVQRVIDRALPGPNILSALVVHKTVDGLPLHRTKQIFKRAGLDIPIRTLNRWEGFGHQLLAPIVQCLRTVVLECDSINLDDTHLRIRDREAEHGIRNGHIWVFVGRKYDPGGDLSKTQEFVFFIAAPTWEAKYPEEFLAGCNAVLQGDAYRGYERIASPNHGDRLARLLAGCCMHARRPFVQAFESGDPGAEFFVQQFAALYQLEEQAKQQQLTASLRLEFRQERSLPLMQQLRSRATELSAVPLTKPLKNGVTYLLSQWDKLIVPFEQDGRLDIDNGSAERRLRRIASGRKVWLFAGSEAGATRFADVLSLVCTADAHGVDAGAYLPSVMQAVDSWPNARIEDLLPHRWAAALAQSSDENADQ